MKQRYFLLLASAMLLAACTKEAPATNDQPQPPQGMAEVTLGAVSIDAEASVATFDAPTTRAAANLLEGATLRLYAFKPGVTSLDLKLATRTYTVNASGAPILDSGQDPLYLPLGDVDIYLVGPTTANLGTDVDPILADVAGDLGIYPYRDVDLIAAYTSTKIQSGAVNPLPALTLKHKMAQVQVEISHNTASVYENLVVQQVKVYAQPEKGSYTLDATGGTITAGTRLSDVTVATITQVEQYKKYNATMLLIPQVETELKIETVFECNQVNVDPGDSHPTLRYRQSGLITSELISGASTRFTAAPLTSAEIKWRTKVLPWNTDNQSDITIPSVESDLIACWDGSHPLTNATSSGDGAIWTDIFGSQLTAIVPAGTNPASTLTYNKELQAIVTTGPVYPNRGPSLVGTLNLGSYNAFTLEVVYEALNPYLNYIVTVQDKQGNSTFFSRPNTGMVSLGFEFTTAWGKWYYEVGNGAKEKQSVVYVFNGAAGTMSSYRNGALLPDRSDGGGKGVNTFTPTDQKLELTKFIIGNNGSSLANQAFIGNIHAVRIYGHALTAAEIKTNYNKDKIAFDLP